MGPGNAGHNEDPDGSAREPPRACGRLSRRLPSALKRGRLCWEKLKLKLELKLKLRGGRSVVVVSHEGFEGGVSYLTATVWPFPQPPSSWQLAGRTLV